MEKKAFFQLKEIINKKNIQKYKFGLNHSNKLTNKSSRYCIGFKKELHQLSCLIKIIKLFLYFFDVILTSSHSIEGTIK